jgi:Pyruvate/2-oxoacid:ferredoxin oxidoreductase gamma subunit
MEREILLTGIGGQSVQLAAQILARAATREQRHVLYLGAYGGSMRGGNTDSTIVVGDAPLTTPPIVSRAWGALVMHHAFYAPLHKKLRPDSVVLVNTSVFEGDLDCATQRVYELPASQLAQELGNPLCASLLMLGAFTGLTGLVGIDALVEGMRESVPAYRSQHLESNERALRAGFERVSLEAPAWEERAA